MADIPPGERPFTGVVFGCSPRRGFAFSGSLGLFPGLLWDPQPRDLSGGRHPFGKTANPRRSFQLQSLADVPQGSVSWLWFPAFSSTHNPVIYPVAAIPPERRPISGTGFLFQFPADVLQCPIPRHFFLAFPRTHNPAFRSKAATPTGRRLITGTDFRLQSQADVPRYPVPRHFSLTFLRTHNPLFQPEAATPLGRRPIPSAVSLSVSSRGSAVSGSPTFFLVLSKPTAPHFDQRLPPLRGDGQLSAPLFCY